jgi:hypothetical protein
MAHAWDDVQEVWLERRLAGIAQRFESKVTVEGSRLPSDAATEHVGQAGFFDFLRKVSLFEYKAPSEVFDDRDLPPVRPEEPQALGSHVAGRTLRKIVGRSS